jgi:hypothetical protein
VILTATLALNGQFLVTWVLHLLTVLFRLYLFKLRAFTIFKFLNYLDINDYEVDLKKAVNKEAARGGGGHNEDMTEDSSRDSSSRNLLETTPHGLKRQRLRRMGGGLRKAID